MRLRADIPSSGADIDATPRSYWRAGGYFVPASRGGPSWPSVGLFGASRCPAGKNTTQNMIYADCRAKVCI